jgi:malonyl-CoA/methylmalonyl-CoA synthetase
MALALFPGLQDPPSSEALRVREQTLDYQSLAAAAGALAADLEGLERVAVWAEPSLETCLAVVAALGAGVAVVPLNPKLGSKELAHIIQDSQPRLVLAAPGVELPTSLGELEQLRIDVASRANRFAADDGAAEAPALILYTSGTTGAPKGVVLPRRAIASNLDALADAWTWRRDDVLAHALPLFHAHGLVLGTLGPIRLGGRLWHIGQFDGQALANAIENGATMVFGVPTMYHRLAEEAETNSDLARALGRARLLVSGSAPLPTREHLRLERLTGQRIVERYGLTETLMNCAIRAEGDRRPGYVGTPLEGVEVKLVADDGSTLETSDNETIGEIAVRGPNLFIEYLNRADATAAAVRQGWFYTGDLACRAPDGYIRIVGRRGTDLIKTGGYKVGAGEVEAALLEHPDVLEVAVTGEADEDLGERIVAWVVPRDHQPSSENLSNHVAQLLTPHKRPRDIHFLKALPRNEMGKVMKQALRANKA